MPKKYRAELRAFALTLSFYSPSVRICPKKFDTCLRHPKIWKWYKSVNGKSSFNEKALQSRSVLSSIILNIPLFGAFIFNEMARQHECRM